MTTAAELGDVMLKALTGILKFLKALSIQLQMTGNNETAVNASRGAYQRFWEIWYYAGAMIHWATNMLVGSWGYVDLINKNATLQAEFAQVVGIAAKNATRMLGDVEGTNSTTFLLRVMVERLYNQSNHVFVANLWTATSELIRLVADALKYFPTYFPST